MAPQLIKKVFISHSWAEEDREATHELATYLSQNMDIDVIWDGDDQKLKFAGNLNSFMNLIAEADYVIILLSDAYLKRMNCMYELATYTNKHKDFLNSVCPVIIGSLKIYDSENRIQYYNYWEQKLLSISEKIAQNLNDDFYEERKKTKYIGEYLPEFFSKIKYLLGKNFKELKSESFRSLIDRMQLNEQYVLNQVWEIEKISDLEERSLAVDDLMRHYPQNLYCLRLKAQNFYDAGLFKQAMQIWKRIIELFPQDRDALLNLGATCHNKFQNYQEADFFFKRALTLEPDSNEVHRNLANNYLAMGELQLAEDHFSEAVKVNGACDYSYFGLGSVMLKAGNYNAAIDYYNHALIINPAHKLAYFNMGLIYSYHIENIDLAKDYFEKAILCDPEWVRPHEELGLLLLNQLKDGERAREHFERAIMLTPKNYKAYYYNALAVDQSTSDFITIKNNLNLAILSDPNNVEHYYALGQLYLREPHRDYDLAKKNYENALLIAPDDALSFRALGNLEYSQENFDLAKDYYEKAFSLDKDIDVHYQLIGIYMKSDVKKGIMLCNDMIAKFKTESQKHKSDYVNLKLSAGAGYELLEQYDSALSYYEEAIDIDDRCSYAYLVLGTLYANILEENDKANSIFHRALESYEDHQETNTYHFGKELIYFNLATTEENSGDFEKAIINYKKAIRINVSYESAYIRLASLYMGQFKDFDEAKTVLEALLELDGSNVSGIRMLFELSDENLNKPLDAIKYLKQLMYLEPDNFKAPFNISWLYHNLGEHIKAVRFLKIAIKKNPDSAFYWELLGSWFSEYFEDYGKAVKALRKSIKIDPRPSNLNQLAVVEIKFGYYQKAKEYLEESIHLDKENIDTWSKLGEAYTLSGQAEKAMEYFQKALSLLESSEKYHASAESYYNMGNNLMKCWTMVDTIPRLYQKAIEIKPDFAEALVNLGIVYEHTNRREDAAQNYLKALDINPSLEEAQSNVKRMREAGLLQS